MTGDLVRASVSIDSGQARPPQLALPYPIPIPAVFPNKSSYPKKVFPPLNSPPHPASSPPSPPDRPQASTSPSHASLSALLRQRPRSHTPTPAHTARTAKPFSFPSRLRVVGRLLCVLGGCWRGVKVRIPPLCYRPGFQLRPLSQLRGQDFPSRWIWSGEVRYGCYRCLVRHGQEERRGRRAL